MTTAENLSRWPPFFYSPFTSAQAIRILQLEESNDPEAPVVGSLEEHAFDPGKSLVPEFSAVSYVWGSMDASNLRDILIRGSDDQLYRVAVTSNCHDAARHLRGQCRRVWIDAICIDQKSNAEKSAQVPLMKDIYSHSAQVLIWLQLGRATGLTHKEGFLHLIAHFKRLVWLYTKNFIQEKSGVFTISGWRLRGYLQSQGSKLTGALFNFLSNDYFHRVWTIQESVLPRLRVTFLVTNEDNWQFGFIVLALNLMGQTVGFGTDQNSAFNKLLTTRCLKWKPPSIPSYLMASGYCLSSSVPDFGRYTFYLHDMRATEPRDRAYASIWLLEQNKNAQTLVPDYSRSIPQVFADFSRVLIQQYGLTITYYAMQRLRRESLPTWSPHWEYKPNVTESYFIESLLPGGNLLTDELDFASRHLRFYDNESPKFTGNTMHVRGYLVDTISQTFRFDYEEVPRHEIETSEYGEYLIFKRNIHRALCHVANISKALLNHPVGEETVPRFHDMMLLGGVDAWAEATAYERESCKENLVDDWHAGRCTCRWSLLFIFAVGFDKFAPGARFTQDALEEWLFTLARFLTPILGKERALEVLGQNVAKGFEPAEFILRILFEVDDKIHVLHALHQLCFKPQSRDRVIFFTSAGRIGSSLAGNVGDNLVVWHSHLPPVLLRRVPGNPDRNTAHCLVSMTYVKVEPSTYNMKEPETFEIQ